LLHLGDRPTQLDRILVNVIGGPDLGIAKVDEIMTQVSKRFGSREDIVFGAVIDESRSQSIELCILGKAEMGAFVLPRSDATVEPAPKRTIMTSLGLETEISRDAKAPRSVHRSKLRQKELSEVDQDEFDFIDADAQRGYFDKTDCNDYNEEDLDVTTFMRRGIKIKIK
jgi:cell division protein FtsZ